jgi:hypothetical protein
MLNIRNFDASINKGKNNFSSYFSNHRSYIFRTQIHGNQAHALKTLDQT